MSTPDDPKAAPGELDRPSVAGRYRLLQIISQSGMEVVYLATDCLLNHPVAVKSIRYPDTDVPLHARRFLAEAQITGQLLHPGVPVVHDYGALPDGRPFILLKLTRGQTLDESPDLPHEKWTRS